MSIVPPARKQRPGSKEFEEDDRKQRTKNAKV